MVCLNQNGSLDTSFDGDGIFTTNTAGTPYSVAVQPDGKIVTAGNVLVNSATDFSIVRLNENGSFDTTFDGDGKVSVNIGNNAANATDLANAIALQLDGKIIVGGESDFTFTERDWVLVCLTTDGVLDTSFGVGGKVQTAFGGNNSNEAINAIAVEASGRITAVGYGGEGGARDLLLLGITATGRQILRSVVTARSSHQPAVMEMREETPWPFSQTEDRSCGLQQLGNRRSAL